MLLRNSNCYYTACGAGYSYQVQGIIEPYKELPYEYHSACRDLGNTENGATHWDFGLGTCRLYKNTIANFDANKNLAYAFGPKHCQFCN